MAKGLPRGQEECVFYPTLGASPDTSANPVRCLRIPGGFLELGGGMWEVGEDKLLCPEFTSLESGVTDRAVPSRKPWLGSKVTFDLLTQPHTVGSCGHSGGCWWEHLLGKGKRVAGRGLFCPQPPASQRKPLWPLQDRPCFPSPTSLLRIEVQGAGGLLFQNVPLPISPRGHTTFYFSSSPPLHHLPDCEPQKGSNHNLNPNISL